MHRAAMKEIRWWTPNLRASAGGEHPTDRCASADSHKTQECHIRISGQQMKHKAGK